MGSSGCPGCMGYTIPSGHWSCRTMSTVSGRSIWRKRIFLMFWDQSNWKYEAGQIEMFELKKNRQCLFQLQTIEKKKKNHRSCQASRTDNLQGKGIWADGKPLIRYNRYQMTVRTSRMLRLLIMISDGTKERAYKAIDSQLQQEIL